MSAAHPAAPPAARHLAYSLYRLLAVTTGASRDSGSNEYNRTRCLSWNRSIRAYSQNYTTLDMFQGTYRLLAVTTGASRDSGPNGYNRSHCLFQNHPIQTYKQHGCSTSSNNMMHVTNCKVQPL